MTFEAIEGGRYSIHVDQDTLSVYVRLLSNDVIRTDDEEPYTFYQYPRKGLVGVGTPGTGSINPTSTDGGDGLMSAPSDTTADTTPR